MNDPLSPEAWMPDARIAVRDAFGLNLDWIVPAFSARTEHVPELDPTYQLDPRVTVALLMGFAHGRRVLLQGMHGTGKSTHIEQVAARLNWPCVRVNLDGHVTRLDLVGRDTIVLREGRQVTEFDEGLLPWAAQRPVALVFDEYDAGRPEVMFVIQRLLEQHGRFTLLEQKRVIPPHRFFRLFATMNTLGLGNLSGQYHGTHRMNHAQLDRWNLVCTLDYLSAAQEVAIVHAKVPAMDTAQGRAWVQAMVALAALTRQGFAAGDLSLLMSPRTVITWAENTALLAQPMLAFELTFLNRCEPDERALVGEYYQRCFGEELTRSHAAVASEG